MRSATPLSVAIVPTGTANTASVRAAFERLGVEARVVSYPSALARAERVVLPGVGALESAMDALRDQGMASLLAERIEAGRPTLAICLGLQLLGEGSDESPGAAALGCLPVRARKLPPEVRVPHMGWNRVEPGGCDLLEPGDAFFAHSYAVSQVPAGWRAATTPYPAPFVSALQRGSVLACQFHPELSGAWGARLLSRWVERSLTAPCGAGGAAC